MTPAAEAIPAARRGSTPLFAAGLVALLAAFVAVRLPLLAPGALPLGWNGDTAIRGLMANRLLAGERFDVFFWGQSYMGPLTSWIAAALGSVPPGGGAVGALEVRLAAMIEMAGGAILFASGLRRLLGILPALLGAAAVLVSPGFLFRESVLPNGPEMVVLLGGALFWLLARVFAPPSGGAPPASRGTRLLGGALVGFAYWMNPGALFVPIAAALLLLLRSPAWPPLHAELRVADRFLVRFAALGWREPKSPGSAVLLRGANVLLALQWLLAALHEIGLDAALRTRFPNVSLFHPMAEPVALFVLLQAAAELSWGREALARHARELAAGLRGAWVPALELAAGAALGCAPVWLERWLGAVPEAYSFSLGLASPAQLPLRLRSLVTTDIPAFLGHDGSPIGQAFLLAALALGGWQCWRSRGVLAALFRLEPGFAGARALPAATVGVAGAFFLLSSTAGPGQHRYMVAALPPLFALLGDAALRLVAAAPPGPARRVAGFAAAAVVALALASPLRDSLEVRRQVLASPDPAPTLAAIEAAGYGVCYANYWQAYQLQFLSGERVRFIPWQSLDRDKAESRRLAALPGPKCFVDRNGRVIPFEPEAENGFAAKRRAREAAEAEEP